MEEATIEQQATRKEKLEHLIFEHLPEYARFIRENYLIEYIKDQLETARELDTPLLKVFGNLPDEQIIEYSVPGHTEFLIAAEENRLYDFIDRSIERWIADKLEIVGKNEVEAEDITQVSYVKKKALLKFLPYYTSDPVKVVAIAREIDTYNLISDTVTSNTYIALLKERINEHASSIKHREEQLLEAQEIADLGSFEWDLINRSIEATPQLLNILDLEQTGDMDHFMKKVHPADRVKVQRAMDEAMSGSGNYECEYRLLTGQGDEKIIWSRGVVLFVDGAPTTFKGTVMDVTAKHHMVQKLQRSEELYKQAQAISGLGNWTWDLMRNKLNWSEELFRIYELPADTEITYDLLYSFNHPDDAARVSAAIEESIASHEPFDIYYRIILRSGVAKILHARGEALVEEDKPYKLLGTLQDVTERQNLIDRLQQSDLLYKQAQALSHLGNWTWDVATNKIVWTDELYRIFGFEDVTEKVTFDKYLAHIHPDDRDMLLSHLQHSLKTHESYDFFHRIIRPTGEERIVQSRGEVLLDNKGEPYQMVGTGQDVTKQQLIERQLRDNREFIQKITNTTPSLIASYNVNTGKYTYINQALEKILGYDSTEAIQNGVEFFMGILHPDDIGPLTEKNARALEDANANPPVDGSEMVMEFKYRMRHMNGTYRWFHTYGTIFDRNSHGLVEHVLNVSVDITEQEEAEMSLYQKNLQLQQSNASLEEYAYVASHDLKEPLRKISTFSDRLMTSQYEKLSDDGRTYINKIIESSKRMQSMISDLLSVSVISGNKAFEVHNLEDILNEVLQTLEYKIEERNACIISDKLPAARVVPSQFRHLFQNLLSNSLKFSREGVQPQIKVRHEYFAARQGEELGLGKANRYLKIDVEDNGIGFDNQFANKIFAIFQRLHGRSEYEGTGIGLAICKKIAENHGGTISAVGASNQGSTFTIIIPV